MTLMAPAFLSEDFNSLETGEPQSGALLLVFPGSGRCKGLFPDGRPERNFYSESSLRQSRYLFLILGRTL